MKSVIRGFATLVALAACSVALAGLGPNGLGPNGLGPNGLGPNGLGPNGLGPNGLGPNGLGPNGLGPNGLGPNGLGPNGLGPNGLGPNGLGPNGLDVNGLGPNGLGPNGLGPNGLVYLITPAGVELTYDSLGAATGVKRDAAGNLIPVPTYFGAWFDADPVAASQYMKYFARCAYDSSTAIGWVDGTGRTHVWSGQYGFAMASLKSAALEPLGTCDTTGTDPSQVSPTCSQQIRARMTEDEGRWVSSCLLAHVNLHGEHQYISIRGNPPNPEAKAAVATTTNEVVFMRQSFGLLFADLMTTTPYKAACLLGSADNWSQAKVDLVLGRDCDVRGCYYTDPAGILTPVLDKHFGGCLEPSLHWPLDDQTLTFLPGGSSLLGPDLDGVRVKNVAPLLHPLKTYGPIYGTSVPDARPVIASDDRTVVGWTAARFGFSDVARCVSDPRNLGPGEKLCGGGDVFFTIPFDVTQVIECGKDKCLGGDPFRSGGGYGSPGARTFAMVDMVSGQAADWAAGGREADLAEPVTALVRYSMDRTANAHVFVTGSEGGWSNPARWTGHPEDDDDDVTGEGREWGQGGLRGGGGGADIWPATGAGTWEYLQIYPVHIRHDSTLGSSLGRSCTVTSDCGAGLTCSLGACQKDAVSVVDASGVSSLTCGGAPGQFQLYERITSKPICVEQCVADDQCQAGDVCRSGRCATPLARVRVTGATMSESCTGPALFRGENEQGACNKSFPKPPRKNMVCPKKYEVGTPCLGSLVFGERSGVTGWFCRGGGEALYACQAADAPRIDAVGFVPTRPWCMAPDATTFVGVCK